MGSEYWKTEEAAARAALVEPSRSAPGLLASMTKAVLQIGLEQGGVQRGTAQHSAMTQVSRP